MNDLVQRLSVYFAVLALCGLIAPTPGFAKEKGRAASHSGARTIAVKKQTALVDADGYRLVSPDSKLRCAQTMRSTLDCRE